MQIHQNIYILHTNYIKVKARDQKRDVTIPIEEYFDRKDRKTSR
jgi:hypothetical protein